jgi:hypothetical protein
VFPDPSINPFQAKYGWVELKYGVFGTEADEDVKRSQGTEIEDWFEKTTLAIGRGHEIKNHWGCDLKNREDILAEGRVAKYWRR